MQIIIDGKDNYQLDGDVVGESTILTAEIHQVPWQSAPKRLGLQANARLHRPCRVNDWIPRRSSAADRSPRHDLADEEESPRHRRVDLVDKPEREEVPRYVLARSRWPAEAEESRRSKKR